MRPIWPVFLQQADFHFGELQKDKESFIIKCYVESPSFVPGSLWLFLFKGRKLRSDT